MSRMEIKSAEISDQPRLFAAHVELFRDQIERIWGWDDERQLANFHLEWDEVETLTIHRDGCLAGYIQKRIHPDHLYLLNLAILPGFQGRKIGSTVIALLQQEAQQQGKELRLSVFKINERAFSFYLRNGFEVTEVTETGSKLHWPQRA